MPDDFRAPPAADLPPARFLTSARIGAWLGVLRRLPHLSGGMKMWINDACDHLEWRETCQPRVVVTRVRKQDGTPATFSVDDSLSDVQTRPSPEFLAWERWLETRDVDDQP